MVCQCNPPSPDYGLLRGTLQSRFGSPLVGKRPSGAASANNAISQTMVRLAGPRLWGATSTAGHCGFADKGMVPHHAL
jgi:hypothetical protein